MKKKKLDIFNLFYSGAAVVILIGVIAKLLEWPAQDLLITGGLAIEALVFGVSNTEYGYSFFIDDKGYFAVYNEGNANIPVKTILDWQYNAAIVSGWNSVEIEQHNGYWTGYVNGKK